MKIRHCYIGSGRVSAPENTLTAKASEIEIIAMQQFYKSF